jgi:hypothetical protein
VRAAIGKLANIQLLSKGLNSHITPRFTKLVLSKPRHITMEVG